MESQKLGQEIVQKPLIVDVTKTWLSVPFFFFFLKFLNKETASVKTKHINQAGFIPHIQTEENFA